MIMLMQNVVALFINIYNRGYNELFCNFSISFIIDFFINK